MLNVQALDKHYGNNQVLNQVSFSAKKGDIIGLVGENGAGKSTLLHILATLELPTNGQITLNKQSFEQHHKQIRPNIGFVPQDIALWEEFTVEENMVFFEKLSWKKRSKAELQQLCLEMHLEKWKTPVHILSGGMKRKLNLAISLIHDPLLLLLDEPTVGIDLKSRQEIGNYLKRLAIDKQKIIIYTSHDMDEILNVCDHVFCLGDDAFYYHFLKDRGKSVTIL